MQLKRNFSAKREAIYNMLASTKAHPSAEWIHEQLRDKIPDLSLGTVYRNLSVFKEAGLAKTVAVVNGQERFDADMSDHAHMICEGCDAVIDISDVRSVSDKSSYRLIEQKFGCKILRHNTLFYGLCRECSRSDNV